MKAKLPSAAIGWCAYDFALSALTTVTGLTFSRWLVLEMGVGQGFFEMLLSFSAAAVLISGPFIGRSIDRGTAPLRVIGTTSITIIVLFSLLVALARIPIPDATLIVVALAAFTIAYLAYQWGAVAYNALLSTFDNPRRISGLGVASNWLGAIVGILLVFGISYQHPLDAYIPAIALLAVVAPISLLLLRQNKISVSTEIDRPELPAIAGIGLFGVALLFLLDAILTVQANLPLYVEQVFRFSETETAIAFLALFVGLAAGGLIYGVFLQRLSPIRVMAASAVCIATLIVLIALSGSLLSLGLLLAASGTVVGISLGATRASIVDLAPPSHVGLAFGIYTAIERAASLLGPLAWALVLYFAHEHGIEIANRLAMGSMALFMILSAGLLFVYGLRSFKNLLPDTR